MRRLILAIFIFAFFSFSVAAVDVSLSATELARGQVLVSTVTSCANIATLQLKNPDGQLVYVDQGNADWESRYNTNSNGARGKYSLKVLCQDTTSTEKFFCVEAPGCTDVAINNVPPPPPADDGNANAGSPSGNSGGGGRRCNPKWQCDNYWTQCDVTLQQSRNCFDTTKCAPQKLENRTCAPCQESWACSAWSPCEGGMEGRTCLDDKDCGTATYKPVEERPCGADIGGYEPDRYTSQVPPPSAAAPSRLQYPAVQKVVAPVASVSFWDEWGFLILALLALLLLVGIILYLLHMKNNKHAAYNSDELKIWMLKEKEAGSSEGDIRQILMEQTGWTKEDVDLAFEELAKSQTPAGVVPPSVASVAPVEPVKSVEKGKK